MKMFLWCFVALTVLAFGPAAAQESSGRPIRLIVPYAPGGGIDTTARLLAEQLRGTLGQTVIVENRAGGSGAVGIGVFMQCAPDGHALMIGGLPTYLLPMISPTVKYDPSQLRPLALITSAPLVLVVRADSPFTSMADLLQASRKRPLNFGSSGVGTTPHLAAEWLMAATQSPATHIPYRGGALLAQAVMAGEVDFVVDPLSSTVQHIKSGRLRALGLTVSSKLPDAASVPLVSDTVPGYAVSSWLGIFAPPQTPTSIAEKLEAALRTVMMDPKFEARLAAMGNQVTFKAGNEFKAFVGEETSRFERIVRDRNIRID